MLCSDDGSALKQAIIRHVKRQVGLDISGLGAEAWTRFADIYYSRYCFEEGYLGWVCDCSYSVFALRVRFGHRRSIFGQAASPVRICGTVSVYKRYN